MKKKILVLFIIVAVIAFASYKFLYKEHRDIHSETAVFSVTTATLQKEFLDSDSLANVKYADKTIVVNGKITNIDEGSNTIVIDEKLAAVFKDTIFGLLKTNADITIKGRFVGYDDLLEEYKMDQVSIVK